MDTVDKNTTGTDSTSVGLEDLDIPQDNQSNKSGEQLDSRPWLFKKGQSGNPGGASKGKKMKTLAAEILANMTDEEKAKWLKTQSPEFVWRMAEGNPANNVEVSGELTSKIISVDE